ncbi:hypothetical protein H0H93_016318 [Arthromyces matolae]|nr:hypothetical protein H0H93_016318 [Arthromyces matolae]
MSLLHIPSVPPSSSEPTSVPPGSALPVPGLSSFQPAPPGDVTQWCLPPLLDESDEDLTDGPTIAKGLGRKDQGKQRASDSTHKGKQCAEDSGHKGKQRVASAGQSRKRKVSAAASPSDDDNDEPAMKRGRPRGSGNYSQEDVSTLLDAIETELPLGQRGWSSVHKIYTRWARKYSRPERTSKSLETKYKQLLKTSMPTGDAYCPPEVKRAHHIEALINERACTRDLDDDNFDGDVDEPSRTRGSKHEFSENEDEVKILNTPAPRFESAIVRRPDPLASVTRRKNRINSMDLVAKLSSSFDPASIKARDNERADRSFCNTQLFTLSQQLRDSQSANESLCLQLLQVQDRLHNAERVRDRAEFQIQMLQLTRKHDTPYVRTPQVKIRKVQDHTYAEKEVYSLSSDSEKENIAPTSSNQLGDSFEGFTIRPPSPFHSAMRGLDNTFTPHFSASADDTVFCKEEEEGFQLNEEVVVKKDNMDQEEL